MTMPTLALLVAPQVVKTTGDDKHACGVTSDDKVGNMTIGGFQWKWLTGGLMYKHEDDYVIILNDL